MKKIIFMVFASFLLLSCNHNGKNKEKGDVVEEPSLSLAEMYVHFQKVENESVTISWPEINTFDIVAKFDYGNIKGEEIPVVMESSPIMLTKDEVISLSVPAVSGKHKGWNGKVNVKKIKAVPQDKDIIDTIVFTGRRDKGVLLSASDEAYSALKKGEYPTIEMKGDLLQFLIGHSKKKWNKACINGKKVKVESRAKLFICESGCAMDYDLTKLNSIIPILLEAELNGKKAFVHFKIKHTEGTCDIPDLALYLNDKKVPNVSGEINNLEYMSTGRWPIFDGKETTKCGILWTSDDVSECLINTERQEIKKDKDGDDDVWYVEYDATDCTTEGKEITVELKSKNPNYHDIKWEFKIKKV